MLIPELDSDLVTHHLFDHSHTRLQTGNTLDLANMIVKTLGKGNCVGPIGMGSVPALMSLYSGCGGESNLLIVILASTTAEVNFPLCIRSMYPAHLLSQSFSAIFCNLGLPIRISAS